jgi:hypothetical protein
MVTTHAANRAINEAVSTGAINQLGLIAMSSSIMIPVRRKSVHRFARRAFGSGARALLNAADRSGLLAVVATFDDNDQGDYCACKIQEP